LDLKKIKLFLVDLDGTTYIENNLIDGAKESLEKIKEKGKNFCFISNNSSRSIYDYLKKFKKLGLNIGKNEVITSSTFMINFLKEKNLGKSVYLLGTKSLKKEFLKEGITLRDDAKTVVVSYDNELTYKKLSQVSTLILNGSNYFATHLDKVCPSLSQNLPDVGSYIKLIKEATGRKPDFIGGKPSKEFAKFILNKFSVKKNEVCFIGDRLYTDIKFAKDNGFKSILVLSGETKKEDLNKSDIQPDLVLNSIKELQNLEF